MSESVTPVTPVTPVAPVAPVAPIVPVVAAPSIPAAAPATTLADLIVQREALLRQQADIDAQIQVQQASQRSGVVNQIKTLMAQHGITADDLMVQKPLRTASAATKPAKDGNKVAAKYRDPATGATWTGRGLKPRWLVAAIEQGRTQDEFLIENPAA